MLPKGRTRPGDTLIIPSANSLAASITELLAVIGAELAPRGIGLEILSGVGAGLHHPDRQETTDPTGRTGFGLFGLAAMAAHMEQATARELTREGSAAAAARGRKGGRPTALRAEALAVARERMTDGESITAIAKHLGVGRSTRSGAPVVEAVSLIMRHPSECLVIDETCAMSSEIGRWSASVGACRSSSVRGSGS
ncbi:recombinase family protein [Streptosporangium canum]|uniref:recombinase family protein n=1 Tax=Streptosporangium canum TaxID=324952 RepID=UPI00343ECEC6